MKFKVGDRVTFNKNEFRSIGVGTITRIWGSLSQLATIQTDDQQTYIRAIVNIKKENAK